MTLWWRRAIMDKAFVHIYTGNGKGKTTAALGLALRAAGAGMRTLLIQFMKGSFPYREYKSLELLSEWIDVERFGTDKFVIEKRKATEDECREISAGLSRVRRAFDEHSHDIVVLDEVCVAVYFGVVQAEEVIKLIKNRPADIELILTGRYCPEEWYDLADLVTEMKEVKHYYAQGILSRPGIDS
ncbi:cob(I)yrinic acid a,c-diamide adenosyltransferase [bacterium]|nr:cob(I)yrinic acid a,c-diamide adenosyltransferase [bacterium]